jgi:hypothetical protein
MSKALFELVYRKPPGAPAITPEMAEWLENFGSDSGGFTLDLTAMESWLEEHPEENQDSQIEPLIQWLRKYLADGQYRDFAVLEE